MNKLTAYLLTLFRLPSIIRFGKRFSECEHCNVFVNPPFCEVHQFQFDCMVLYGNLDYWMESSTYLEKCDGCNYFRVPHRGQEICLRCDG